MPDQTPVTDLSRRARDWAERRHPTEGSPDWFAVKYILDTIPAPPATLADELREVAANYGMSSRASEQVDSLADRVEAVEKESERVETLKKQWAEVVSDLADQTKLTSQYVIERDEARAEVELLAAQIDRMVETSASKVERLTRERDEARASLKRESEACSQWMEFYRKAEDEVRDLKAEVERLKDEVADYDRLYGVHEEDRLPVEFTLDPPTLSTLPDPADVPEGEPWEVCDELGRAVGVRYGRRWVLIRLRDATARYRTNAEVTLVSRLVPETRRVIDRPEDLDKLPAESIVRGKAGRPWRSDGNGHWDCGMAVRSASYVLHFYGPVTVIYEPEVTS